VATIVVFNEEPDTQLMPPRIFAERERFANQIGTALPQRGTPALHMRGLTSFLAYRSMAL